MPFTEVDTAHPPMARKLVLATWGLPKEGQTTIGIKTFPDPVYLYNFNYGYAELLRDPEMQGRRLYVVDYRLPDEYHPVEYRRAVTQFQKDWREGCDQAAENGGTVMIYKDTELWQLIGTTLTQETRAENELKASEKGKQYKQSRLEWGPANLMMSNLQKRPFQVGCNALYTHSAKEQYSSNGEALGTYKMHGFSETSANVQVVMEMFAQKSADGKGQRIKGRIERCRFIGGQKLVGTVIADPTYATLMAAIEAAGEMDDQE